MSKEKRDLSEDLIGQVLNDTYRITAKIDEGGMGVVFEAAHVRLTKSRFAVKVLHSTTSQVGELFARFRREAEVTSELGHPHIVNVLDFLETPAGQPYMVMEFL